MKILILSWRDIRHPFGGGAELLSHEMASRWVRMGNGVTHFSAAYPNSKLKEVIDGVVYLRGGGWYSVHFVAFWKILTHQLGEFDIIVDEVHGYPFFANLYSPVPVVCLACEVAKDVWDQMYGFPINLVGRLIEKIYLLLYKQVKFLTISLSTKSDLIASGILAQNITVLPMGFNFSLPNKLPQKNKEPTVIFLGRLAKSKGIPDAIKAFSIIHKSLPKSKFWIVGRGTKEYEEYLHSLVGELGLTSDIDFKGFVSEKVKFELLSESQIILVPSIREGWGLIVPEANIVGTPAVVYNCPGLRDVTKNGRNGMVVKDNSPEALAEESLKLLQDNKLYRSLCVSSIKFAKSLNWDDTAKTGLKVLRNITYKTK